MIKRETIKQAINAIAFRDPEAGYVLNDLLGAGHIDIPPADRAVTPNGDFIFLVQDRPVTVKRYLFFNEGTVPIERGLLIKYGELLAKSAFQELKPGLSYKEAARKTREAGLKYLVCHEIDDAVLRLQKHLNTASEKKASGRKPSAETCSALISFFEHLKKEPESPDVLKQYLSREDNASIRYQSIVQQSIPVLFVPFPYTLNTLMQVADINFEFFHVRFLLNCLIQGSQNSLFMSIAEQSITGMLFLDFKKQLLQKQIEVVYVATVMGRGEKVDSPETPAVKGAGSVLMAGTWILWKTRHPDYKEIFLDSEIAARSFYDRMGFHSRGLSQFVMGPPEPYLLKHIIRMLSHMDNLPAGLKREIQKLIDKYAKVLVKQCSSHEEERYRRTVVDLLHECLRVGSKHNFTDTAVRALHRYQKEAVDIEALMKMVHSRHEDKIIRNPPPPAQAVRVLFDERYAWHLENVFHLENPKRILAMKEILGDPSLTGKWLPVTPRYADKEELAWVHSPAYVDSIAQSAGRQLTSFDMDTQASEKSYDTARLAVGGVFSLLDSIRREECTRGFACVRPPGHHAEPGKAMGFCLFNTVALAARYLLNRLNAQRVLIVDLDAHHGNGIQEAFYQTNRVLYISTHLFPGYPGTGTLGEVGVGNGEGYTVNIPMAKGSGDSDFARALHCIVRPIALAYQPDIMLIPLGFDLFQHDRLGGMNCSAEGYGILTAILVETAETICSGRIAFVLEGGYSLRGIRECGLRVLQELCGIDTRLAEKLDKIRYSNPDKLPVFKKVVEIQKKYWKIPL